MSAGPNIYAVYAREAVTRHGSIAKARAEITATRNGPTECVSFYNATLRALAIIERETERRERAP